MNSENNKTDLANSDGAIDDTAVDISRRSSDIYQRFINRVKQIEGEEYNDIDAENKAQPLNDKNTSDNSFDYNVPIDDSEDDFLEDNFLENDFVEDSFVEDSFLTDYQQHDSQYRITENIEQETQQQEEGGAHTAPTMASATSSATAEHPQHEYSDDDSAYSEAGDNDEVVENIEPTSRISDYKTANDAHQLQKKAIPAQARLAPKHKTSFKLVSIGLLSGVLLSAATVLVLTKKDIFSTSVSTLPTTADTNETTNKTSATPAVESTDSSNNNDSNNNNNDASQPRTALLAKESNSNEGDSNGKGSTQPSEPVATYTDRTNQPAVPSDSSSNPSNNEAPISLDDFLKESKSTLYRETSD